LASAQRSGFTSRWMSSGNAPSPLTYRQTEQLREGFSANQRFLKAGAFVWRSW
jgi:hypothetical protein